MLKIIDWIFKIITLPFTIISLPFKILDWIVKLIGLLVIVLIIYWFDWIPVWTLFVNSNFPEFANFANSIKSLIGLTSKIPVDKIPLDKLKQVNDLLTK